MKRRTLLAGGSAAAGVALFSAALPRFVGAADGPCPKFVFVVEGNCVEPVSLLSPSARAQLDGILSAPIDARRNWYRSYGHTDVAEFATPDLAEAVSLAGLGSLASRASVLYGMSGKITGGGHTAYHGVLSATRTVNGSPGGATIDAFLASRVTALGDRPFDVLRVGVGDAPLNNQTCAIAAGQPAPLLQRPTTAYQVVLGAATGDEGFERQGDMLNFALEDMQHAIDVFRGPSKERAKLQTYAESIEEVIAQQSQLQGVTLDPSTLPPSPMDDPRYTSANSLERLSAQFDIVTTALQGGLTNIAVIGSGTGTEFNSITYPSITGSSLRRHTMHHESGADPARAALIHEVSARHIDYIAALANRLEATPDVDGSSMLDNTVIVYIGDNGEQHHTGCDELPVLLVGGENLGLRGGRTLVYPGQSSIEHRRISNLWITLAQLAGVDVETFGKDDFSRVPSGALPGLV